ncbi:MAG: hypothetical protein KME35_02340 [Aphanocapsa sp. GSE-SYN-MK-11-07L]|nr:hypothetical protein [Aphanocapsa sp. GSE-SYN-MK-11-07L]
MTLYPDSQRFLQSLRSSAWETECCEAFADNIQKAIIVFYDGQNYWSGTYIPNHQTLNHFQISSIPVVIRSGGQRDAILFSLGADADHAGISSEHHQRMRVATLLQDLEWQQWSDVKIAQHCGASPELVTAIRQAAEEPTAKAREPTAHV